MKIVENEGVMIIVTDDRLDSLVATKLKNNVKKLADSGKLKILIDMGNTRFIDSAGCGALVASLRAVAKNKGAMKIAQPSPQVQTLFELTRLHKVFEIYDDVEAARGSFS